MTGCFCWLFHGSAESRAVGAMEEWAKCCGDLAGAGKEEQDGDPGRCATESAKWAKAELIRALSPFAIL